MSTPVVLVVAKAPVPGFAKTRLAATVGDAAAADLAACALLDTLDAARASGLPLVVAMTGDLAAAARGAEITAALVGTSVVQQRGDGLGERLAHAHADAFLAVSASGPVPGGLVQVGMDTPQVTSTHLREAADALADHDAALGPADDGGWWLLAVRDPATAAVLAGVPMSTATTGELTARAVEATGATLARLAVLRDVDEHADAEAVADAVPGTRFGAAWRALAPG